MKKCSICKTKLNGKQERWCSDKCCNKHHQNYAAQQRRGIERKRDLVMAQGGACCRCGYDKNLSALVFHHIDPSTKVRALTIRECSNNKLEVLLEEAAKCMVLCHNCHSEEHNPDYEDWK